MSYRPPYSITSSIVSLVADISQRLGFLSALDSSRVLYLRRLAIEGNTLSEQQITAVLDGKLVIAPPREVQEVRNAIKDTTPFNCGTLIAKKICWQLTRCS